MVLILLPPSEGKTAPAAGAPFAYDSLHFPELNPARELVMEALAAASAGPQALSVLKVGASLAGEVARNTALADAPAAPAHEVYSGVLYDALGYGTLPAAARSRADETVLVASALWGTIGFADRIAAYRLSMGVRLPETGPLGSFWKRQQTDVLDKYAAGRLVVDCRSGTYAAAWAPDPANTAAVNVFQIRGGKRTVVSHFAKHTRGELARHLLLRGGTEPAGPQELLAAAAEKWEAELVPPAGRRPYQLNLILPEDAAFTVR